MNRLLRLPLLRLAYVSLLLSCSVIQAFPVQPIRRCSTSHPRALPKQPTSTGTGRDVVAVWSVPESFSSITLAEESWRQYVSLVVIGAVLIDILLGSPLANLALKPLRPNDGKETEQPSKDAQAKIEINKSRERIDSDKVAKAAIERAQNALELRRFLDERKTDWDRMEDMKRKLDAEMQVLDADLKAREASLNKESKE